MQMLNHTALNWKRKQREQFFQFQGSHIPRVGLSNQIALRNFSSRLSHSWPQIEWFDGDPFTYWTFVCSFNMHIVHKMPSKSTKLVYLFQHCSSNIRQNLEDLSKNLNDGYCLAHESLHNEFGHPHIIANCYKQRLLDMPHLKVKNLSTLKSFGIMLYKSLMLLYKIQEFTTLNSLGILERFLKKWVKYSYHYQKHTGQHAKFPKCVNFVCKEVEQANYLYGRSMYKMNKASSSESSVSKRNVVFGAAVAPKSSHDDDGITRPLCSRLHHLSKYMKFKGMGHYKQVAFLMHTRRYFKCLEKKHLLKECSSSFKYEVKGCSNRWYPTLLHKSDESREKATDGVVCRAI